MLVVARQLPLQVRLLSLACSLNWAAVDSSAQRREFPMPLPQPFQRNSILLCSVASRWVSRCLMLDGACWNSRIIILWGFSILHMPIQICTFGNRDLNYYQSGLVFPSNNRLVDCTGLLGLMQAFRTQPERS